MTGTAEDESGNGEGTEGEGAGGVGLGVRELAVSVDIDSPTDVPAEADGVAGAAVVGGSAHPPMPHDTATTPNEMAVASNVERFVRKMDGDEQPCMDPAPSCVWTVRERPEFPFTIMPGVWTGRRQV